MKLKDLLAALAEKQKEIAVLKAKAEAQDAAADAHDMLVKAVDEFEAIEKQIADARRVEKALGAKAVPASDTISGTEDRTKTTEPQVKQPVTIQEKIGVGLKALIHGRKKGFYRDEDMVFKAMDDLGYSQYASDIQSIQKASSLSNAAGGFTIPDNMNTDVIEFLNPYTRFLQAGPQQIPMPTGSYRQPGQASQPTAAYRGETAAITSSDLTFREINMKAKLLSSMVPVTNQIIRYSAQQMVGFVQSSMGVVMGLKMDEQALVGTGSGANPLGILRLAARYTTAAAAGVAPTQAVVDAELRKLVDRIANVPLLLIANPSWFMSQRTFGYLQDLRTPGGENYAYPTLQGANPTLKGYPVYVSSVIVNNEGGSTNASRISLVTMGNVLLGITKALEFAVSEEATVNGVSMFETDQTAIRATSEHDWEARYDETVAELSGVQWGA